jgi:hypothetical protein
MMKPRVVNPTIRIFNERFIKIFGLLILDFSEVQKSEFLAQRRKDAEEEVYP